MYYVTLSLRSELIGSKDDSASKLDQSQSFSLECTVEILNSWLVSCDWKRGQINVGTAGQTLPTMHGEKAAYK